MNKAELDRIIEAEMRGYASGFRAGCLAMREAAAKAMEDYFSHWKEWPLADDPGEVACGIIRSLPLPTANPQQP